MPNPFNQSDHEDAARERIVKPHTLNKPLPRGGRKIGTMLTVDYLRDVTGVSRVNAAACFHAMLAFITDTLVTGRQVNLLDVGTFKLRVRKGRTTTWKSNPLMGNKAATRVQPDRIWVSFKASGALREALNKPKS